MTPTTYQEATEMVMNTPGVLGERVLAQALICPGCEEAASAYWVTSTPDTDTWACRHCGAEWTITVHVPGVA